MMFYYSVRVTISLAILSRKVNNEDEISSSLNVKLDNINKGAFFYVTDDTKTIAGQTKTAYGNATDTGGTYYA